MKEMVLDQLNLYIWAKDKNYRYIYCNENYAKAAGIESPHQIIGKTDEQMPWSHLTDYFRAGDYGVLQGVNRINSVEVSDTIDNVKDTLVTENQLLDKNDKCIGIIGSLIDITGKQLIKKAGYFDAFSNRYYLGEEDFGGTYLTMREISVFKRILLGYTAQQTASSLQISRKTIEGYIENIKYKLQAKSRGEIVSTAIQFGLTHIMYLKTQELV